MSVQVDCRRSSDDWTCHVEVVDDAGGSSHAVGVRSADLARLDPTAVDPIDLVRRSFAFLLEREPKAAILASFDLMAISRYFPDYESEIGRRV